MFVVKSKNNSLLEGISRASTVIGEKGFDAKNLWANSTLEDLISNLDSGVAVAVIDFKSIEKLSMKQIEEALENIPAARLALSFTPDVNNPSQGPNFGALSALITNFIIVNPPSTEIVVSLKVNFPENQFYIESKDYEKNLELGINTIINDDKLTVESFVSLLLLNSKSDREDGLFPTVVVDPQGVALGLCYSSKESIVESLKTKSGVYFSRTRGLWYKGKTSGATQELISIDLDCDADTLRFTVVQKDPDAGITALYSTLASRLVNAPPKSYTKRLFDDKDLLHSKIREEADELCAATTKDDIAWEAADLIYFAMAKCVAAGVTLTDIEKHLDSRSKKISRRPGNAKPQYIEKKEESSDKPKETETFKMKTYHVQDLSKEQVNKLLLRPIKNTDDIMDKVKPIVDSVKSKGDAAIKELTEKFDKVKLESVVMKAPFPESAMVLDPKVKQAIDLAYSNIEKFHAAQIETEPLVVETMKGVTCSRFARPIEKVGLYVPGGTAILPSTTLMLGIPAKVAGCKEIVIATPPKSDGTITPEVVYVAHRVGASTILLAGGAQAVAALAYGTETVPKVDKICGPGNQFVTAAKMIAQSDSSALVSIDIPAGPSELLVIADNSADPRYVISDLLSQAEHGVDSQVILIAIDLSDEQIKVYQKELFKQGSALPRAAIAKVSISHSYILNVKNVKEAVDFSNQYAPEHLILNVAEAESILKDISNAGSVFVGPYSAESCGDYASGTNHTLPTYGYSKMYSGVNTATFVKHITSQTITKEGLDGIGDAVTTLAHIEGLEAHRNAVAIRLADIRK
ncbi:trifunctional histidinol dehydrogenase [Terramyces sp. JEL0728]|nr:trifunctional histidinol dehydrogenase [Terramyces sp. JEL0728]KAJ3273194.1 trifunctional histidinol dehydrogenase [Terramyces sp. JEL0728]